MNKFNNNSKATVTSETISKAIKAFEKSGVKIFLGVPMKTPRNQISIIVNNGIDEDLGMINPMLYAMNNKSFIKLYNTIKKGGDYSFKMIRVLSKVIKALTPGELNLMKGLLDEDQSTIFVQEFIQLLLDILNVYQLKGKHLKTIWNKFGGEYGIFSILLETLSCHITSWQEEVDAQHLLEYYRGIENAEVAYLHDRMEAHWKVFKYEAFTRRPHIIEYQPCRICKNCRVGSDGTLKCKKAMITIPENTPVEVVNRIYPDVKMLGEEGLLASRYIFNKINKCSIFDER